MGHEFDVVDRFDVRAAAVVDQFDVDLDALNIRDQVGPCAARDRPLGFEQRCGHRQPLVLPGDGADGAVELCLDAAGRPYLMLKPLGCETIMMLSTASWSSLLDPLETISIGT